MAAPFQIGPSKRGGGGLTFTAPPQPPKQTDVTEQNRSMLQKLLAAGESNPLLKGGADLMGRIFGVLDTPGTAVRTLTHNALNGDEADLSVLGEVAKSAQGQQHLTGSHILSDVGVGNKWVREIGGFALDIALDPLTYLSGGLSSMTKVAGATRIAKLVDGGIDAAKLVDAGVDIARLSGEAQTALKAGKTLAAPAFSKADTRIIASAVRSTVGRELGDAGGIKFLGQTLVPAQEAIEGAAYKAKDLLRALPGSEWFERAFISGDFTDIARGGNELVNKSFTAAQSNLSAGIGNARRLGSEVESELRKALPDATERSLATYAIGRQFGSYADHGTLDAAKKALDLALETGDKATIDAALSGWQRELRTLYDPDAIAKTMARAGVTDEAAVKRVTDAVAKVQQHFDGLIDARKAAGLEARVRYPGADELGAAKSAGFAPGALPNEPSLLDKLLPTAASKERQAAQNAADLLTTQTVDEAGNVIDVPLGSAFADAERRKPGGINLQQKLKVGAQKSKEYANAEARLVEGGLATETDIARLANAKTANDYTQIAVQDFRNTVARSLGIDPADIEKVSPQFGEMFKRMQQTFVNEEATRGLLHAYDKAMNLWKRSATVYRFPAFPLRNGLSNVFLLWTHDIFDPVHYSNSLAFTTRMALGKLTEADKALLDEMASHGVLTSAADIAEQVGRASAPTKLGAAAQTANELVENQGRIAAYMTARAKGLDAEAAAAMVNKALYDYGDAVRTGFETAVAKRAIPFYKWMRNNTPTMFEVLFKNPRKIAWLGHLKDNGDEVNSVDESVQPDWLTGTYPIRTPLRDKAGNPIVVSTEGVLPYSDLEKLTWVDPRVALKESLAASSPLVKLPLELLFNREVYSGDAITRFKGETRRAPGYVEQFDDIATQVPGLSNVWASIKDKTGIIERKDAITGEPYLAMPAAAVKTMRDLVPWMNAVGKTMQDGPKQVYDQFSFATGIKAIPYDTARFEYQKAWEDNSKLRDATRKAKAEGKLPKAKRGKRPKKPKTLKALLSERRK